MAGGVATAEQIYFADRAGATPRTPARGVVFGILLANISNSLQQGFQRWHRTQAKAMLKPIQFNRDTAS